MRLGKNQLQRLKILGCPGTAQIVGCKITASLERRGLVRSDKGDFVCITPAGLRVLADEMEAGRVSDALEWAKKERAKNAARNLEA
jgi:hypothetical protein